MLLIVGVIPAFAVAAVIEGFVTGRTGAPIVEVALGAIVAVGLPGTPPVPVEGAETRTAPARRSARVRAGPST